MDPRHGLLSALATYRMLRLRRINARERPRLSGGEQQRVAIARALINDPGLLLADEPSGNLDSATGEEIVRLLLDLRDQRGMSVIVATHDPVIASRCDRIVRLLDGRVVADSQVPLAESATRGLEPSEG